MSLSGKTAVVTGSTSGIGLAIAHALAAQGSNVLVNGLEAAPGEGARVAAEIAEMHGVQTRFSGANMLAPRDIAAMIDEAAAALGGVHILVNNAGVQHTAPVEAFPEEAWDRIMAINLSAAFHAIKAALPHMRRAGWGRIVNTASVHGLVASVHKAAYVAAKHGLVGLTKVVALENADQGITCNAICPGWVETPLIARQIADVAEREGLSIDDAKVELVRHKQPSRRFVQPGHIGAMVVFLCSDAAAQMTGAALPLDGAWTAQ